MPDEDDGSGRLIDAPHPGPIAAAAQAYRMRWKRRRLLWRSFRSRHALRAVTPHPVQPQGAILAFACVRNEALRLPYWLAHNRRLGVDRFLVVDNGSDDGTRDLLADQPDVSLWSTDAGYKASRFGMDWLNHLLTRFGAEHWCLTVDADELLVYPHSERLGLAALAAELERRRQPALGTLMVELYPKGPLAGASYLPGQDPTEALPFFDAEGYRIHRQRPARNLWVQGGPRERVFFADRPALSPTLNKLPFLRWRRGQTYLISTHSALPPRLNLAWDGPGDPRLSGALLHTKFLPDAVPNARIEKSRRQHFHDPDKFAGYYDRVMDNPEFWHPGATRYEGWAQLERLGLLSRGGWIG